MLDSATGELRWAVAESPIGIYPYAPALVGGDAAAVRNCLNTLASNSLCIYAQLDEEAPALGVPDPAGEEEEQEVVEGGAQVDASGAGASGAAAQAGLPALAMLACAALPLLLL